MMPVWEQMERLEKMVTFQEVGHNNLWKQQALLQVVPLPFGFTLSTHSLGTNVVQRSDWSGHRQKRPQTLSI